MWVSCESIVFSSPNSRTGLFILSKTFHIPDYELVIEIERGSYGQVWLARSVLGAWRAVKIVQRNLFDDARPYNREFNGIRFYEAVSRGHQGLIDVLHVGRNDQKGYFYYVMELADDQVVGQATNSVDYSPRTLQSELNLRESIAADECAFIGAQLADALRYLHEQGLVHRDIKPSNIVYVNGMPKLADIGLVAGAGFASANIGTLGFQAGEETGDWRGDLYALGKVLYEASTGMDRNAFPDLPQSMKEYVPDEAFKKLNRIILKACSLDEKEGYTGADQLTEELELINAPSMFSGPFSWREKRLVAAVFALVLLLGLSDALLIYVGLKDSDRGVVQHEEVDPTNQKPIRGKYGSTSPSD